jgi:hypothetical protein
MWRYLKKLSKMGGFYDAKPVQSRSTLRKLGVVMEGTGFVVLLLLVLGFGSYIFLMIFYPEWVGITGKSAKKTMSEHKEGSQVDDSDVFK